MWSASRAATSCSWSTTWVENPEWLAFCEDFLPQAIIASHKILTTHLIPKEVQSYQDCAIAACHGHEATLECDGWSGVNHHHLLAFIIAVLCKVYTIHVADTTNQVKNADNLLEMLHQIVAVTSDCSGESQSARKRLLQEHPDLVAPDCYAHQVHNIVDIQYKNT
ncbi:hypothetical protein NEOLEDRAFT_1154222 [Neolentinus lepideus HHB14362 ss-1]|uniref:DUF659 domain-containing protein n=1 Tax=Neolentinus lepideus HHB14362 ss-1 TaxID=1314782 RepID=A0A165UT13_9AGAM|nr:hypothetical protein NEOLEDRAFT_1154222 [Neolentinus lepideus HHB14362 ss-1]